MTDTTPRPDQTPEPEDESLRQRVEEIREDDGQADPDEEEHVHGDRIPDKDDEGNPDAPGVGEPEPDAV